MVRRLMTQKAWESKSNLTGRRRSTAVLEIDRALLHYHGLRNASPGDRARALDEVQDKVQAWFDKKEGEGKFDATDQSGSARRLAAMKELRSDLDDEQTKLALLGGYNAPGDDVVEDATDIKIGVREMHRRAVRLLQRHLSLNPTARNRAQLVAWNEIYAEASTLRVAAMRLADEDDADDEVKAAARMARALKRAIAGFTSLAYAHFKTPHPRAEIINYGVAMKNISTHMTTATRYGDADADQFLHALLVDLARYSMFSTSTDDGPGNADMSDEHADVIGLLLGSFESAEDLLAYQGTAGKGNTGFAEAWNAAPDSGTDDRSGDERNVANIFGSLSTSGSSGDLTSGIGDMSASLGGLGGVGVEVYQALATLKDPDASAADRRAAYATLAATPLATLGNAYKFIGGALTTQRGATGSTLSSDFGFTASGTDGSTDIKIAGDFSALFAGIIDSIKQAIDTVLHFKDRSEKQREGGVRRRLEDLGGFFQKTAGTLTSLANNAKAATKLGYQIAGGGQVASGAVNASAEAFMKHAVPGMNLAMAVLDAVHQTYKLVRIGIRRSILSDKMEARAKSADSTEMEALEFAHGSLVKRTNRLGINLGHALAAIVGGGLNTSGIGLAPGMVISVASTATKLGQVGVRTAKQAGRDRKAGQRRKKDEERDREFESFAEFRLRKRIDASKAGKWEQFKTKIDLAVTYNWDKASANKAEDTRTVAFEILRLDDDDIYKAIGVLNQVRAKSDDPSKQLSVIEAALKKRD